MKNDLIGLLPYGFVIWLHRRFLHKQEDLPFSCYHGVRMRIHKIVKSCLPYFLMRPEPFKPVSFPSKAVSVTRQLSDAVPNGRTVVFAMFSRNGRIRETTRYYIDKLGDIADNVVVFGDCPIIPDEVSKLPPVVRYCSFGRHGEYDFGSYKRGYEYVMQHPVLSTSSELLLCNDSCYGPVTPFANVFAKMATVDCDFWGLCENWYVQRHIQSYFLLFKRRVFLSPCFASFMRGVQKEESAIVVIIKYEIRLTRLLEENGFVGKSAFVLDGQEWTSTDPTYFPVSLMRRGCPLVKVKVIGRVCVDNKDGVEEILSCVRMFNEDLYRLICDELSPRSASDKRGVTADGSSRNSRAATDWATSDRSAEASLFLV